MQEDLNGKTGHETSPPGGDLQSGHAGIPAWPDASSLAEDGPAALALPHLPLPGLVKLFLAQQYILALGLFFMAVVCLLLAGWLGGVMLLIGLGFAVVGIVCCVSIYRIHTRSPGAPALCAGFIIFTMVVNILLALIFGVQVADSYYYRDLSQIWAGVLSLVACLPVFYGLLRYFRISGRVAEVFSLPEPNLPSPTMALGVFRVFCAVLLVGTAAMLPLAGLETIGVFDGLDRESGMVMLFYLAAGLPQLVFPLIGLIMTARWQEAMMQNRQPERGLESARNQLYGHSVDGPGFFRLLTAWIAVSVVWPTLTGYTVLLRIQTYDGYLNGLALLMSFPIDRGLLPLIVGAFLWRFATAEEERGWLGGRILPEFGPGRLGAILTFGVVAIQTIALFGYRLVSVLLGDQKDDLLVDRITDLASPMLGGLTGALALYAVFLLFTRHHNAAPVGRSAAIFGLISSAAGFLIESYFRLTGEGLSASFLVYSALQLLEILLSCGVALYFLARMAREEGAADARPGEVMRPLGVIMFQFFCGMAILANLSELGSIFGGASGYLNEFYYMLSDVWTILLPLLNGAYFFLPVAALLLARRQAPFTGPLLPVLYLWLLSIPGRMLASAALGGRLWYYGVVPSFYVQFVMYGLLGFTWYFHSQRK